MYRGMTPSTTMRFVTEEKACGGGAGAVTIYACWWKSA
jgi:hypothetical protein